MDQNEFMKYIGIGMGASIATLLLVISGLVVLLERQPQMLASVFPSLVQEELANERKALPTNEDQIVETVAKANPAVVAITISKNVPVYERFYQESPFGSFFSIPQIRQRGTELQEVGGGSGFLVSLDGYIVTNRHVVNDENAQYTVFTNDGESYEAQVIARDSFNDVAIIKIEGEDFEHLTFGDSNQLRPGQSVIAIGNALAEFRNTISVGVVSGLSRSITAGVRGEAPESLEQLIQTDAAINQGNSGGPLLNLDGEVVGVNVAIVSGAQNVGFALSSNSVKNIVDSVKETGRIVRPYLGVRYVQITPELQEAESLPIGQGAWVRGGSTLADPAILPASPAALAGLQEGDVLTMIDGVELTDERTLASVVQSKRVGENIAITYLRDGEEHRTNAILQELPPQ